jgi:hypothetical protein
MYVYVMVQLYVFSFSEWRENHDGYQLFFLVLDQEFPNHIKAEIEKTATEAQKCQTTVDNVLAVTINLVCS